MNTRKFALLSIFIASVQLVIIAKLLHIGWINYVLQGFIILALSIVSTKQVYSYATIYSSGKEYIYTFIACILAIPAVPLIPVIARVSTIDYRKLIYVAICEVIEICMMLYAKKFRPYNKYVKILANKFNTDVLLSTYEGSVTYSIKKQRFIYEDYRVNHIRLDHYLDGSISQHYFKSMVYNNELLQDNITAKYIIMISTRPYDYIVKYKDKIILQISPEILKSLAEEKLTLHNLIFNTYCTTGLYRFRSVLNLRGKKYIIYKSLDGLFVTDDKEIITDKGILRKIYTKYELINSI